MRFFFVILTVSMVLVGCNTGSPLLYTGGGVQCDPSVAPIPIDAPTVTGQTDATYAAVDPTSDANGSYDSLPKGFYTYRGVQAYIHEPTSNFIIETTQIVDSNNNLQEQIACVNNFMAVNQLPNRTMTIPTMRDFYIDADDNVTMAHAKTYGFIYDGSILTPQEGPNALIVLNSGMPVSVLDAAMALLAPVGQPLRAANPPAAAAATGQRPIKTILDSVYSWYGSYGQNYMIYSVNYPSPGTATDQSQIVYQIRANRNSDKPPWAVNEILLTLIYTRFPPPATLIPQNDPVALPMPPTPTSTPSPSAPDATAP